MTIYRFCNNPKHHDVPKRPANEWLRGRREVNPLNVVVPVMIGIILIIWAVVLFLRNQP